MSVVLIVAVGAVAAAPTRPAAASSGVSSSDRRIATRILEAIDQDRWAEATALVRRIRSPLARTAMRWRLLSQPANETATFTAITAFVGANADLPGRRTLLFNAEQTASDTVPAARLVKWFNRHPPRTDDGRQLYIDALAKLRKAERAREVARRTWIRSALAGDAQDTFLQTYGRYLEPRDHQMRLQSLLRKRMYTAARRLLETQTFAAADKLIAETRILMRTKTDWASVDQIKANLARISPTAKFEPDFLYDRLVWNMRLGRNPEAHKVLGEAPRDPLFARRWWRQRSKLIREALEKGTPRIAYQLASDHRQTTGVYHVDAEWLAGWIALRHLKKPADAQRHFIRIFASSGYAISIARGAYWAGRAAKAAGDPAAAGAWYRKAALYPTVYYGQLAVIELGGQRLDLPPDRVVRPAMRAPFQRRKLVRMAHLFAELDRPRVVRRILFHVLNRARTPDDHALVAELALKLERRDVAVRAVKKATRQSYDVLRSGFPRVPLPTRQRVEPALIFALIRQESEFHPEAVSPAGARGLMQLMPRTARSEARALKKPYRTARLTTDEAYNVLLGSHHMNRLLERFNGSYVLAIAAYNAGSRRAEDWSQRFGDPRTSGVDVVDWIEQIPFGETRNYVQRVLENLHIYRVFTNRNRLSPKLLALWSSPNHRGE